VKLDKMVLANAFGLATVVLWTGCSILVALFPGFTMAVTRWWMHGMDISAMGDWNLNFNNFLLGGIAMIASAWITGWVFGWSWEKVSKK
jgi:hypothetical protein